MKLLVLAIASLLVFGCTEVNVTQNQYPQGTGTFSRTGEGGSLGVQIAATDTSNYALLAKASDVDRIVVTVSGGGLTTPLVLTFDEDEVKNGAKATFEDLAPGIYTVSAVAYDGNTRLGSDSENASVEEGQTTTVHLNIVLDENTGDLKVMIGVEDSKPKSKKD